MGHRFRIIQNLALALFNGGMAIYCILQGGRWLALTNAFIAGLGLMLVVWQTMDESWKGLP